MINDNPKPEKAIKIPYGLISLFLAVSIIIIVVSYYYNKKQEEAIKTAVHAELLSISRLDMEQIVRWRNERIQLANVIKESEFVSALISDWFANQNDQKNKFQILRWMTIIRDAHDYHGVFLLDANKSVSLSVCDSHGIISAEIIKLLDEAMSANKAFFTNIYRHESENTIEIDIVIPVKIKDKPLGWLIFAIDPYKTLFPIIKTFPRASQTGEALLVSQDNDHVVFLNELRHQKDTALMLQFPLTQENLPAVQAVKGKKGIVEGIDYRGVPVVAAVFQIPDSPWFIVAKVDKSEAYAVVREKSAFVMILSFILIISTGLGLGFVWRNQRIQFYKNQYAVEKEHSSLLQRYEYLTRYANDVIFLIDAENNNIIEANERAVETYGYSMDELIAINVMDIRAPEAAKMLDKHCSEVIEHDGYVFETLHKRKNGEIFPVEVSSRSMELGGSKVFLGIVRDITERKQAEKKLKEKTQSLKDLEDIINKSPAVAFLCSSAEGLPIEFISANISMYGYRSSDIIIENIPFTNLIYYEDIPAFVQKINELDTEKIPEFSLQHRVMNKTGDINWAESRIWPIFDAHANITHYQGVLIDITEEKKLHEQLMQAQKMEAVGKLAGGVAHDFNNILTAITGYGYMLRMKVEEDEVLRRFADQILASSERAAQLTQSLLLFSRKQIMSMKPIDLNSIVRDLKNFLSRLITKDIEIKIFTADDKLTVMGDKTQIEQVLMNLVTNAIDAMPEGGSIIIETGIVRIDKDYIKAHGYGTPGLFVLLSVTDSGAGIDEQTQKRIFEPFFTTKQAGQGTGLGLSIVYGIIKQHNGYINLYSEVGKGSTFKVYLPLTDAEASAKQILEEPGFMLSGTETILIAEDEDTVRHLYKEALEAFGYEVIEAENGEEAIRKFKENSDKIQLLILDVVMPIKNGKEANEEIKKINPHIKTLFTSGYTENVIHKKGILDLELDFISKPISPNVLIRKVRDILNRVCL